MTTTDTRDEAEKWLFPYLDRPERPPYPQFMGSIADIDIETTNATRSFIEKVVSRYDLLGVTLFSSRARKSHRADSGGIERVLL